LRRAVVALAIMVFGMGALAAAQETSGFPDQQNQEKQNEQDIPVFKSNVKLVNVFTTVVDEHGAPVPGLKKEDFEILEDGKEQRLAIFDRESELPLSIVLSIDASGSTRKDLPLEVESARKFAHSIVRPVDAISLYQFSEDVDELVPFTADLKRIDRGAKRVRPGGGTALYDAIYLGSESLLAREGRKVLLLISDGGDTVSSVKYDEARRAAQQAEAILYSIIVVPIEASAGRNLGGEHALIQLSRDTGGKHYYASTENLDDVFRQISDELRTQYLLGYYPAQRVGAADFRRIEVKLKPAAQVGALDPSKVSLRHRTGYYTSAFK
jgi:Ca-activated chloride channel homolog